MISCIEKFLKCEIRITIVGNFKAILSVNDHGKAILDGIEFRVSKIIYKDIFIKVYGLWSAELVCMCQCHSPS